MATSLVVAGRDVGDKQSDLRPAVLALVSQYRKSMQTFSRMPVIEAARFQVHRLQKAAPVSKVFLQAERATPSHSLQMLTEPNEGSKGKDRIFKENKPLLRRVSRSEGSPNARLSHRYLNAAARAAAFSKSVPAHRCSVQSG